MPEGATFQLMFWSWKLDEAERRGLTTRQFARYHLLKPQLGGDLTHVRHSGRDRGIAPAEEVLALRPELRAERTPAG